MLPLNKKVLRLRGMCGNLWCSGTCCGYGSFEDQRPQIRMGAALPPPFSIFFRQLAASLASPSPQPISARLWLLTAAPCGASHPSTFLQFFASHGNPFILPISAIFRQLALASGSPSPIPISAISWQLVAPNGSPSYPIFLQIYFNSWLLFASPHSPPPPSSRLAFPHFCTFSSTLWQLTAAPPTSPFLPFPSRLRQLTVDILSTHFCQLSAPHGSSKYNFSLPLFLPYSCN